MATDQEIIALAKELAQILVHTSPAQWNVTRIVAIARRLHELTGG
jgi:hypothetical protein